MEENYFLELENFEENKLQGATGHWEMYCCEKPVATTSSSTLIRSEQFVTDEQGRVRFPSDLATQTEMGNVFLIDDRFNSAYVVVNGVMVNGELYKKDRIDLNLINYQQPGDIKKAIRVDELRKVRLLDNKKYVEVRVEEIKNRIQFRLQSLFS